jgi:large subunit ribosomal protein L5
VSQYSNYVLVPSPNNPVNVIGIPVAVKTTLRGPAMASFLSTLSEVVLPRVKDFEGVHYVQNEKNGSINFGFPGSAMSLFPQIEGVYLERGV